MKIKVNSWHYWLANCGLCRVFEGDRINFCQYCRYVLFGLFHFIMFTAVGALAGFFFVDTIYELFMFFVYGEKTSAIPIIVLGTIGGFSCALLIGVGCRRYIDKRWEKRYSSLPEPDGFFTLLYQKIKTKTCFTVDIEETK